MGVYFSKITTYYVPNQYCAVQLHNSFPFSSKTIKKTLDPSYKMDLDFFIILEKKAPP